MQAGYSDEYWDSPDGLKLHYRDYPGRGDRPPLVCIPALIRNARDFEPFAEEYAGDWRVLSLDLRGRGMSDYAKDATSYNPLQYAKDIIALLDQAGIDKFVAIGTSLGGIVTMLLAELVPERIAGALINDIGPDIEAAGLDRLRGYVGQGGSFPTWMHAARYLKEIYGIAHPDHTIVDWLAMARRLMAISGGGRIVFDYDMRIGEQFNTPAAEGAGNLWSGWRALAGRPVLVLRGDRSDLLSEQTFRRMGRELPEAELVTVAGVGHAPSLDEPEAREAIARLLAKCA
ncbi:MAG TPA: alpha/beta hydrolase [Sphingomonadaceae bacterium]|nr:alpha/beta hydrolase [Sphingomonadaceae bacterium]